VTREQQLSSTVTQRAQSAAIILSDKKNSVRGSDAIAWSKMAELSFMDEEIDCPSPAPTSCPNHDHESQSLNANQLRTDSGYHRLPAFVSSPAGIKEVRRPRRHYNKVTGDTSYGTSASAYNLAPKVDNNPQTDNNCSAPRSLPAELPEPPSITGLALRSLHQFKIGLQSSFESLSTIPSKTTLRRCWGALKETLDELGNVWDEHAGNNEHKEGVESGDDCVRSVSAPVTPVKQSPREPTTPKARLPPGSMGSRPSHYDTLTLSRNSRSSKRKPKPRLRYKNPTPTRKHVRDIDHTYSTEDESSDPHLRLLNRLLFPDPSCLPQDDLCIFMYKQDSRTGYFDLLPENAKPVADQDTEATSVGAAETLPDRSREKAANALDPSSGRSARQSVAYLTTDECQHGLLRSQQTCETCNEIELNTAQPHMAENSSAPLLSGTDVDSRARLLVSDSEATTSSSTQMPEDMRHNDHRVPTPDNLRDDVKEIISGHANGNKAVDRKGIPASKPKLSERIKEALRPQHPDLLQYKPGLAKRSEADPLASSNFHMSDDGTMHRVVEHPPTLDSDPGCGAGIQLTKKVKTGIPKAEGRVNEWLGRIESDDDAPADLSSNGASPSSPAPPRLKFVLPKVPTAEVTHQPQKVKRRSRVPESCAVLFATVPPERDITDLFRTPFVTFERELRELSLGSLNPPSGDNLMSAFGVSYDIGAASHNHHSLLPISQQQPAGLQSRSEIAKAEEDLMSSFGVLCIGASTQHDVNHSTSHASDIMSQSAAMGSLSTLSHTDNHTRAMNAEVNRTQHDTAHITNTSWFELDDAKKMPCCWKPSNPLSRNHTEHRAIRVYNLHNMFQAAASQTPLRVIAQWLSTDEWNYRMQRLLKHA